jgi:hypothetical protein
MRALGLRCDSRRYDKETMSAIVARRRQFAMRFSAIHGGLRRSSLARSSFAQGQLMRDSRDDRAAIPYPGRNLCDEPMTPKRWAP